MFTPIRAVFAGDGSLLVRCAEAFAEAGHAVMRIASTDAPVLAWAQAHGFPVELVRPGEGGEVGGAGERGASPVPRFDGDDFDVLFSIGWLHRLPEALVARARRIALNFHDGPLPRFGGLNAPAWALMEGRRHHGITWHEITPALDGGRIAREMAFDLAPDESAFSLNTHCYEAGFQSFLSLVDDLARGTLALRAPSGPARLYSRHQRPPALGVLDWQRPAAELAARVRALDFGPTPNPLALPKLWVDGRLLAVGQAHSAPEVCTDPPGTVLSAQGSEWTLATGDGRLRLEGLRPLDGGPPLVPAPGLRLSPPPEALLRQLELARPALSRGEWRWRGVLQSLAQDTPLSLPHPGLHHPPGTHPALGDAPPIDIALQLPEAASRQLARAPATVLAACAAWLAALSEPSAAASPEAAVTLAWRDEALARASEGLGPFVARWVPLRLAVGPGTLAPALCEAAGQVLGEAQAAGPLTRDLWRRLGQRPGPAGEGARGAVNPADGSSRLPLGVCLGPWPETHGWDAPPACLWLPNAGAFEGGPLGPLGPLDSVDPLDLVDPVGASRMPVWRLRLDARRWPAEVAAEMAAQLEAWLARFVSHSGPVAAVSLLPARDEARLEAMNRPRRSAVDWRGGLWRAIERAGRERLEAAALEWAEGGVSRTLTHAALQARVRALAAALRARGVGRGAVVGVCLARGPDLPLAVLAVLACGAAYLPLDPDYPPERLRSMCRDAALRWVIGPPAAAALLAMDPQGLVPPWPQPGAEQPAEAGADPGEDLSPEDLAYLIYTSGSTGQPKGVEITQGNVLHFFAGMDLLLPREPAGRWLAVTSLSFDISVLELLWTLTRGFTVVLHGAGPSLAPLPPPAAGQPLQFSLFYFASEGPPAGGSDSAASPYRLLLEGARFADAHGFAAVWTPERHFHAFGGSYPNPALASAALAMCTRQVQLRAGSCVLPLHHPLQVAEDWAVVDRLSGGRVGVSFAAGWQPQDFVLAPQAWADRRQKLFEGIDAVRRLWRGEALAWPGPEGRAVSVVIEPRPVQPELPVWVTAAGNPQTFAQAGAAGCYLLTHLLGQSVDEVAAKIGAYRQAWRDAGHAGQGQVTLMLHTFVGDDEVRLRETARGPLKAYLRSALDLIRRAQWRFPTFAEATADGRTAQDLMEAQPLSEVETEALLEHAFARYWQDSALVGTPARCLAMAERLRGVGVDEIACLIDFGIDSDAVLAQLPALAQVMRMAQHPEQQPAPQAGPQVAASPPPSAQRARALSVADAMRQHRITHLQCTPTQAAILLADEAGREALARLSVLLVGGEALPPAMARALRERVPGQVLNMYGPTEATVWCACGPLEKPAAGSCEGLAGDMAVSLGKPLSGSSLHLRTAWGQECPAFVPGELCIAGGALARGYRGRPDLTAQRFIDDPLQPGRRLYRSGDQVRRHPGGRLEFLGRQDLQVKIRGHRIELGEIEAALAAQPGVREAVVVACRDAGGGDGGGPDSAGPGGETWLQAFVTPQPRPQPIPEPLALARALAVRLPDYMLPHGIALRDSLPTTPNGKIDRQALARLGTPAMALTRTSPASLALTESPSTQEMREGPKSQASEESLARLEGLVQAAWCAVLGRPEIGRDINFFDLGGHSLAVIQVQRRLREATGLEIAVTDMFRLTTVEAQARHLAAQQARAGDANLPVGEGLTRARVRARLGLRGVPRTA